MLLLVDSCTSALRMSSLSVFLSKRSNNRAWASVWRGQILGKPHAGAIPNRGHRVDMSCKVGWLARTASTGGRPTGWPGLHVE